MRQATKQKFPINIHYFAEYVIPTWVYDGWGVLSLGYMRKKNVGTPNKEEKNTIKGTPKADASNANVQDTGTLHQM